MVRSSMVPSFPVNLWCGFEIGFLFPREEYFLSQVELVFFDLIQRGSVVVFSEIFRKTRGSEPVLNSSAKRAKPFILIMSRVESQVARQVS